MSLHNNIISLSQAYGLSDIQADEAGHYDLDVDDAYTIKCYEKGGQAIFISRLHPLPSDPSDQVALLTRLLRIAFLRGQDHQQSLAWDDLSERILVYEKVSLATTPDWHFKEIFIQFASACAYWHEAVNQSNQPLPSFRVF